MGSVVKWVVIGLLSFLGLIIPVFIFYDAMMLLTEHVILTIILTVLFMGIFTRFIHINHNVVTIVMLSLLYVPLTSLIYAGIIQTINPNFITVYRQDFFRFYELYPSYFFAFFPYIFIVPLCFALMTLKFKTLDFISPK